MKTLKKKDFKMTNWNIGRPISWNRKNVNEFLMGAKDTMLIYTVAYETSVYFFFVLRSSGIVYASIRFTNKKAEHFFKFN